MRYFYSPLQAFIVSFLTGPPAAIYTICHNYKIMGRSAMIWKVILVGILAIIAVLLGMAMLQSFIPGFVIWYLIAAFVWVYVEAKQINNQIVQPDPTIAFQPVWKVVLVGGCSLLPVYILLMLL